MRTIYVKISATLFSIINNLIMTSKAFYTLFKDREFLIFGQTYYPGKKQEGFKYFFDLASE